MIPWSYKPPRKSRRQLGGPEPRIADCATRAVALHIEVCAGNRLLEWNKVPTVGREIAGLQHGTVLLTLTITLTFQSNHTLSQLLPQHETYLSNHTPSQLLPQHGTYLSNHTLDRVYSGTSTLLSLLELNGSSHDAKKVAVIKILKHHDEFDLRPLFEWEFKFLPMAISWFQLASSYELDFETNIEQRELSSIYQFIRGMPLLYVELGLRKELEDMKYEDLSIEKEQLKLKLEQSLLDLKR